MEQKIINLVVKAKQVLNLLENHFKGNLPKRTIDKYDQLLFSAIIKGTNDKIIVKIYNNAKFLL